MAAAYVTVTPALAELISSLPQDEVPIKLRCAICSKLAVNAFRTPCCEQMICENCKMALRSTCPVCEHTPMSADDCKPNKALRMTTKAFLKTAEKKRDSSQAKESTPLTPVDARPTPTPAVSDDKPPVEDASAEVATADVTQEAQHEGEQPQADGSLDKQQAALDTTETTAEQTPAAEVENEPSGEMVPGEAENPEDNQAEEPNESNEDKGDAEAASGEADGDDSNKDNSQQNPSFQNGLGFGGGMNGSFPNMNFGGDFNQMQMMMAMQNGMAPNFGAFPMMGMPGMGMDPSMMNMYQMNNGFGPGMDMSMMNGGMGGFNGSMGADGNWNGPQSWNNGQNNYNHPNASGMGNGDYGDFNSAYQAGYNQGNFGPHNQFNAYRGRGFYRGGRGFRGRGNFNNFGRGGFGYGQQGNFQGQNYMNQQDGSNMMDKDPNGPQPLPNVSSGEGEGDKTVDEFGRTIRPEASQDGVQDADKTESVNENGDGNTKSEPSGAGPDNVAGPGQHHDSDKADSGDGGAVSGGDPAFAPNGNFVPADPSMRPGSGPPFGGHHARGGNFGVMPPPAAPVPDVPLNAPKGPKAMRQGLPNTSLLNLRARGYQIPGGENFKKVQSPSTPANGLSTPVEDEREHHKSRSSSPRKGDPEPHRERSTSRSKGSRDQERDRSRHRDRHGRERDRSESAAPSRSRSGERRDRKRKSRRDHSASDGERDYDRERRHRHRSSKKYLDEEEEPRSRSSRDEKYGDRSRSASPAGSRKASHRSSRKERDSEKRRDRDRDREKDRDRERDYSDDDRDYKRKSSHRSSHRDRDRDRDHDRSDRSDRDRDRDREKDKDRERRRERDRERDREREKRHSKRSTAEPPTPTEPAEDVKPFNPPTGPRGSISKNFSIFNAPAKGFEIKGAFAKNSTSTSSSSGKQPPSGPAADRDRDRERGRDSRRSSSASASKPSGLDPHAAERERRNRERLLKETQRLAQFTGLKRRNADDASGGSDAKRSRTRRGGQVVDEDDEARLKKSEAEREESRWG